MMSQDDPTAEAIVYVVDDDHSVRESLRRVIKSHGLQVATFESAREFLDWTRPDVPACLLLDVQMPGKTGIQLQEELVANGVNLPIVFMTAHGDIPMTVKAMQDGAVNFLQKPVNDDQLIETIRLAIDRDVQDRKTSADQREFLERVKSLSKREHEIMTQVITGKLNKQIARRLGITEYTVKVHRGRVMEKTGVPSLAELVRLCDRVGIATADA